MLTQFTLDQLIGIMQEHQITGVPVVTITRRPVWGGILWREIDILGDLLECTSHLYEDYKVATQLLEEATDYILCGCDNTCGGNKEVGIGPCEFFCGTGEGCRLQNFERIDSK